MIKENYSLSQI